jgi:hypothetical protein
MVPTIAPTIESSTVITLDCMGTNIAISAVTSVVTTLCVIFAAYYLVQVRNRCKAKYLRGEESSYVSSSISSDMETGTDELFWFEDVYVDQ